MNFFPLEGRLLVSKDPRDVWASPHILAPDAYNADGASYTLRRESCTGFCHVHNPRWDWYEPNLTGRRIIFEAYAGRRFRIGSRIFYILREESVLAIFEGENAHEA